MPAQQPGEVGRSRFLLALEDDLEVEAGSAPLGAQRVDRGENRHHAGFVVRGAARVDPPVVAGRRALRRGLAAGARRSGQQQRLKGGVTRQSAGVTGWPS